MNEPEAPDSAPEAAAEAASEPAEKTRFWARLAAIISTTGWLFIALGSFSDASLQMNELTLKVMAMFTNSYDYELIDKLHVGNTVPFVESTVGNAQVKRDLGNGLTANYFFSDKYLLTLFYKDDRVTAFTVVTLEDGFNPEIPGLADVIGGIGEFPYEKLPAPPEKHVVDDSPTASYYLEAIDTERSGRFLDLYMGSVSYGTRGAGAAVSALYKATVYGEEEDIQAGLDRLRAELRPNLFGRGEVPLELVEKSLLSTAEFMDYFDPS